MPMLLDSDIDLELIQSPLNYTGGKFKLLPQILPLFPENIDIFVDLFCGGANVGVNIKSQRINVIEQTSLKKIRINYDDTISSYLDK